MRVQPVNVGLHRRHRGSGVPMDGRSSLSGRRKACSMPFALSCLSVETLDLARSAKKVPRSPRVCAASARGAPEPPEEARQQPFSNRRNTISPLTDGFRGKKSRLALQGQFLLSTGVLRRKPNVFGPHLQVWKLIARYLII